MNSGWSGFPIRANEEDIVDLIPKLAEGNREPEFEKLGLN
jgi:hypothetical protein